MTRRLPVGPSIEGDWSPRLHEVDLIELSPVVPRDALRDALRGLEVKVHCTRGRGLRSPVVIVNGNQEAFGSRRLLNLRGRVVLCLGAGWGSQGIAASFLRCGARAFIASDSAGAGQAGPQLFFAIRFLYEIARNGASVRDAWIRAGALDRELRRFQLYVARSGHCHRLKRPAVPVRPAARRGGGKPYWMGKWRWSKAEWKPSPLEIDIVGSTRFPVIEAGFSEAILTQWGIKAHLHSFSGPAELTRQLRGKGLKAPLVLLTTHGYPDDAGGTGIILHIDRRHGRPVVFGHDRIRRIIRLPGRVVIEDGCGLGHPKTARAFLAGKLRGYIGERYSTDAWAKTMFIQQFLYT